MRIFGLLSLLLALVVGALCFVWHGFSTLQIVPAYAGSDSPAAKVRGPAVRSNDPPRSNDPYKADMDRARAAARAMQRNRQDADQAGR